MRKHRWIMLLGIVMGVAATAPAYVRVYRVHGSSDAPSYLVGDRILVVKTAYDVRFPYTDALLLSHSQPQVGDMVMFRTPENEALVFKRVLGCPGDTVAMDGNHLEINGVSLQYERVDKTRYGSIGEENNLGTIIEIETGHGRPHMITHTPGSGLYASFGPIRVPNDHYFLMGPRRSIQGKVSQ